METTKMTVKRRVGMSVGRGETRVFRTCLRPQDGEAVLPIRLPPYGRRTILLRRSDFGGVPPQTRPVAE